MAKKITLNQLGVMIESVDDKVKALAEGHRIIDDKVTKLQSGQGKIEVRLDKMDMKMDVIHSSLKNEIKVTFTALNEKIEDHIKQPSHTG